MKAVVVHGPKHLRVEEVQESPVGPGEVAVDIAYGGICGSDLHYWQHGRNGSFEVKEPLVLGHEVVGRVRELGEGVTGWRVGDAVAIHPATPCPEPGAKPTGMHLVQGGTYLGSASTTPHTQGGLVEVLHVQARQLRRLPASLDLRTAALAEPLAIALHGIDRAAGLIEGARCFVSGAGPIGLLAAAVLKLRGAAYVAISDLQPRALEVASSMSVDETFNILQGEGPESLDYDVSVEAAGAAASLQTVLDATRRGGTVVQLGILPRDAVSISLSELGLRELTVFGSQRFETELDEAVELLAEHTFLAQVISHDYALHEAAAAFTMALDSAASSKVLIKVADLRA
ncbi:L-idonate 5-dehydrogenase [Paeniglutamicibacter sp. ABSL32-1]|uniref:L-idonate 5-dehydrogenase n=1 Tax=Paeniglutamicibacter quisquiliarum TaxID=2849498 RepID=UPI001C2DC39D|nr:L-idonate 5-dehydrogenase [Paeniglutamicibacter quisquiliarum]